MAQLMISYRVADTGDVSLGGNGLVIRFKAWLESHGYTVFIGEAALEGGHEWAKEIQRAIRECKVFLALCSPDYGNTKWTKREYILADSSGKPILPIWGSGVYPPDALAIFMMELQRVPSGNRPLVEMDFDAVMREVLSCLRRMGCLPCRPLPQVALLAAAAAAPTPLLGPAAAIPPAKAVERTDLVVRLARTANERVLLAAAEKGKLPEVERLLSNPATNPNVQDKDGGTALHLASKRGHTEVVAALLRAGADVGAKMEDGETALHWASINGHTEVMAVLLQAGADKEAKTENGSTALHLASRFDRCTVVEALLQAGADKEAKAENGGTALHWASIEGYMEVVAVLLQAGADKEAKSEFGFTPLHVASMSGHTEVVEVLLRAGAHTEVVDKNGATALHWASQEGHTEAVEALLQAGADMEAKEDGETPLAVAKQYGKAEVVALLEGWRSK